MIFKLNRKLKISDDLVATMFSIMTISIFIANVAEGTKDITGIPQTMISTACKIIIFISLLPCAFLVLCRFNRRLLLFCILTLMVLVGQLVCFQGNKLFDEHTLPTFLFTIFPVAVCFFCLNYYEYVLKLLIFSSYAILICFIIVFFFVDGFFQGTYSMGLTNSLIWAELPLILSEIVLLLLLYQNGKMNLIIQKWHNLICSMPKRKSQ